MAIDLSATSAPSPSPSIGASRFWSDYSVFRAPLVPFVLAGTAGIVLDRYAAVPLLVSLLAAVAGLLTWAIFFGGKPGLAVVYLIMSAAALGAGYHHGYRNVYAADDIGEFVTPEARPAQVRGVLDEEPSIQWQPPQSSLQLISRALPGPADPSVPVIRATVAVIRVAQLRLADDWLAVSGRARLIVAGQLDGLHAGDEIEAVGRLSAPHGPANPGEFDYAAYLLDQRIRAQLAVVKTPDGVTRLTRG